MITAQDIFAFTQNFSLYFTMTIFVLGTIGGLINIGVLTTLKLFRSNQCAFYLIIESTFDTLQLFMLFIINILSLTIKPDPGNNSLAWCRIRFALPQTLRLIATSMVCFAALDQFLSTNPQLIIRQMSSLRLAHRLTAVAIFLWICQSIPCSVLYEIVPSSGCIITNVGLIHYYSFFYYPILHGLLPVLVSSSFALLAYRNVRNLVRRQVAVERRRLDRQLTAMIFVRVVFFVLFLTPYTIYRIYSLNDPITPATLYPFAVDQLIYTSLALMTYLNHTVSFYIFMASSSRYRRQVKSFFVKKCWRTLKNLCNAEQNIVHPSGAVLTAADTEDE
ncbi:unnamed protein product [Adineta steineri]|uniref:G-protein coupled receptors family 1 profile domain-containing protein n=1 Tax=Adineta steineri TaxID=433720 RepID=A0A814C728_9BILA|nr:unnamed protein product [Adineta steineri]CAF1004178.1 unnamed protein product [Adineta steineri]CAF3685130.1 unnamed protein product [Adineta steineri]CAF3969865.1 unnamed protein product [Adineta steineri]